MKRYKKPLKNVIEITKEFVIEVPNGTDDPDYIEFSVKVDVGLIDNGDWYEQYGKLKFHSIIEAETDNVNLKDCIITEHEDKEMKIILDYIETNMDSMREEIAEKYDPKKYEPDFDDCD